MAISIPHHLREIVPSHSRLSYAYIRFLHMFARVPRANHMCTFQGMTERTELSSVIRIQRRSENMKDITKLANKYYTAGVQGI